jgi:hypothetical protein
VSCATPASPTGRWSGSTRSTESPPAPILHDVADHVSDDLDRLGGRWDAAALRWTSTAVVVLGALVAALLVAPAAGLLPLAAGTGLLLLLGVVLWRWPAGAPRGWRCCWPRPRSRGRGATDHAAGAAALHGLGARRRAAGRTGSPR